MQTQEIKHSKSAVLGLQHLLAMYSGSILVPIMIAGALGYSTKELTYLISTDIFMCGVATFLQLQVNKYFGIGLPVVLGVAFQSVAPLSIIGAKLGSGAIFGSIIVSGLIVILISGFFSKIRKFFPPLVTGSVITTIGSCRHREHGQQHPQTRTFQRDFSGRDDSRHPVHPCGYDRFYPLHRHPHRPHHRDSRRSFHGRRRLLTDRASTADSYPNAIFLRKTDL